MKCYGDLVSSIRLYKALFKARDEKEMREEFGDGS